MATQNGKPPNLELSLVFVDQIGLLRRWANHVSRPSEADRIMREIDKLVRWQAELRKQVCQALGLEGTSYGWGTLVNHIANEHERAESQFDPRADKQHRDQLALPIHRTYADGPTADALRGEIRP